MSRSRRWERKSHTLSRPVWARLIGGALAGLCAVLLISGPAAWAAGNASLDTSIIPQPVAGWTPVPVAPTEIAAMQKDVGQIGILGGASIAMKVWGSPTRHAALEIVLIHLPALTPEVSKFPQAFADGACFVQPGGGNDVLLVPLAEPAGGFSASCSVTVGTHLNENMVLVETHSTFVGVVSTGVFPLPGSDLVSIGNAQVARLPVPPPPYGLLAALLGALWAGAFVVGVAVRREPSVLAALLIIVLTGLVGLPLYLLGSRAGRAASRHSSHAPLGGFGLALAGGQPGPWAPAPVAQGGSPVVAPVVAPYDPARFERQQAALEHATAAGGLPPLGGDPAPAAHAQSGGLPPLGGLVAPAYGGGPPPFGGIVAPAHSGGLPPLGGSPPAGGNQPVAVPAQDAASGPPVALLGGLPPLGGTGPVGARPAVPVPAAVPPPPPAASVVPAGPPAGWYPDERESGAQIYWDGAAWGTRIRWDGNAWIPIAQ